MSASTQIRHLNPLEIDTITLAIVDIAHVIALVHTHTVTRKESTSSS